VAPRPERVVLRERYDRRQADVVRRAARVFARRGYGQTSVPELAEALGIATGGLYHYFGSKEQLLIGICDQLMDPLLADAQELLARNDPPDVQLRLLVRRWVGHVTTHRDHMIVFQQERHAIEHGAQWRKVRESRKQFERLVESVIRRACDHGVTRVKDPRLTLAALLGMVNYTAQWYRSRGRLTPVEIADGYVELVLDHTLAST
jgi:AcrR family transcriptional regulator